MQKHSATRILIALLCYLCTVSSLRAQVADTCLEAGQWARPTADGANPSAIGHVLATTEEARIVLLGEAHDDADHHLWQLQALSMLLGQHGDLVIGMEMFPRRVQPVLDRWIDGELSEKQMLEQSDWDRVWRFDPDLYLPILRFARLNKLRLVALNVERSLIAETGKGGWNAVATEQREGITDPAPALDDYRSLLRSSFFMHSGHGQTASDSDSESTASSDSAFEFFVQAQLVWDRAFAQGLVEASAAHPASLVVGIIGTGHLQYGHGVPHQLQSMGIRNSIVWLPVGVATNCAEVAEVADAVFAVAASKRRARPRLGVYLQDTEHGVAVGDIVPDSVAAAAGLAAGDRIVSAAGVHITSSSEVIAIVRNQSPGTWLPLTIARDGKTIEVVAKFPVTGKDGSSLAEDSAGTSADD